MLVVIDTNIFVSGVYFGGVPGEVIELIDKNLITPCFTKTTYLEFRRVLLSNKFVLARSRMTFSVADFLGELMLHSRITDAAVVMVPTIITSDPADNEILACAISAGADFIVSGDNHLLSLKSFSGISIVTPKEFIKLIHE